MRKILFLGLMAPAFLVGAAHPDRAAPADHHEHSAACPHGDLAGADDRSVHHGHAMPEPRHHTRLAAREAPRAHYPPCEPGPGDDRCIQLYERGVRSAYAGWQQRHGTEMRTSRHREAVRVAMRSAPRATHRVRRAGERG